MSTLPPNASTPSPDPGPWPPAGLPATLAGTTPEELAALLIAGALSAEEAVFVQAQLDAGDERLMAAVRDLSPAAEALLNEPVSPAPVLKAAVMARVDGDLAARDADEYRRFAEGEVEEEGADDGRGVPAGAGVGSGDGASGAGPGGLVVLRAREQRWKLTGVKGVRYRTLVADRRHNRRTILLKMDAGTALPDHGHAGLEEVYVIEGDLSIGDERLVAGDYFRVQPGVTHGVPTSKNGCVAMVISGYAPFPVRSLLRMVVDAVRSWVRRG